MKWDPGKYLEFADLRARPFHELVARIGARSPRRVVDLGCGPGNLTAVLAKRWPGARLEAVDGSAEMVAAARAAGIAAEVGDVREWVPEPDTDVVVSNAVLQWVPGHRELLRRWAGALPAGAWLAVQVPGNGASPFHAVVRELARSPEWVNQLGDVVWREEVDDPRGYADPLADAGCAVDAWETTYLHRVAGPGAVLEWVTGTVLRPVRAALDDVAWDRFRAELAPRLAEAYPSRSDGSTWFPFRRVFVVARV
ncbi:trans-aconitate 2-methyltransferase [Amycolatopsis arida]|uniref:Trans-aconitate 2-methyltransferase n=1 Tax=Amycolatopsis arida TaxID=587909 RepID=A0A1I5V1J4_9PSEU|nr:trans-aconitate 2-methyltransferase [Amycolatopsis arida]TDX91113.1 trans-aconitate 2-methyltransferase [Amycolatopsis arida]SFQ01360.1 trans-aconitate 2-methyltransferase [Amycolatopsis arida]